MAMEIIVSVSVSSKIFAQSDAFAKKLGTSRKWVLEQFIRAGAAQIDKPEDIAAEVDREWIR